MTRPPFQNPQLDGSSVFWPGGKTGLLMLHGLTATTVEMQPLGRYFHERGYTVSAPLLPGHGTQISDLSRCRWQDWAKAAETAYFNISERCNTVILAGESMGGLLSLWLSSRYPEAAGVMVYAPAMQIHNLRAAVWMSPFIRTRDKSYVSDKPSPLERFPWQGYTQLSVPALAQLYRLQKVTRKALPLICQPALIFQGLKDATIQPSGANQVYNLLGTKEKQLILLDNSPHCIILGIDFDPVAQKSLEFVQKVEQTKVKSG